MADPYYSDVSLLLHCDGSNGSTTFTDNSATPKTVTAYGNAGISTAQSKFGGASGYFDGNGDYLSIPAAAAFEFGANDFTIEFWYYATTNAVAQDILNISNTTVISYDDIGIDIIHDLDANGGKLKCSVFCGGGARYVLSTAALPLNQFVHVAFVRYSDVISLYLDGIFQNYSPINTESQVVNYAPTFALNIGKLTIWSQYLNGYIDELRITDGVARYTAGFTPSTSAFPNNSDGLYFPLIGTISLTGQQPALVAPYFTGTALIGQIILTGEIPELGLDSFANQPLIATISLTGQQPNLVTGFALDAARGSVNIIGLQPSFVNRLPSTITNHWISTHYRCCLTGAADGLENLELPISSFQTRMNADPFRIYLSVVVPGVDIYIDAINARPNGLLKITRIYNYLDGSASEFGMSSAAFDTLLTNQGGRSGVTGTLTGSELMAAITPQTIELFDPITRSSDSGGRRYRCRIDPRVRPLDTVIINSETFTVDSVIYIIDTKTAIMEVAELI